MAHARKPRGVGQQKSALAAPVCVPLVAPTPQSPDLRIFVVTSKLKQIAIIFLIVSYLASSLGMACTTHYCHEKVESSCICLFDFGSCAKGESDDNCCKQVCSILKVNDNQKTENPSSLKVSLQAVVFISSFFKVSIQKNSYTDLITEDLSPPPKIPDLRVYISSFTI